MLKVKVIEQTDPFGNVVEIVNIENDDGSNTSMLKSTYDAMQAEQAKMIEAVDE
jgi:hypothetical protein